MTEPTQAQIEAIEIAKEHLRRSCMPDAQDTLAKIVALTAGEPIIPVEFTRELNLAKIATVRNTIERCAQVAWEQLWRDHRGIAEKVVAAIRALKDAP